MNGFISMPWDIFRSINLCRLWLWLELFVGQGRPYFIVASKRRGGTFLSRSRVLLKPRCHLNSSIVYFWISMNCAKMMYSRLSLNWAGLRTITKGTHVRVGYKYHVRDIRPTTQHTDSEIWTRMSPSRSDWWFFTTSGDIPVSAFHHFFQRKYHSALYKDKNKMTQRLYWQISVFYEFQNYM